ncbi:16S rRNA (cytidine(1402)-2'-O)-methyltransferase [Candidatus Parcubacteria bacterium A4]|nr:MAG: 16S rRNA (cytidine(1402)-2'-O)-methyltransferase [Candidatus Parcubacteria bacterium A4]
MSALYIVATPIGNLQDISQRAIEVLNGVDLILCEDTRVAKRLLDHYEIKTPTISYHQHSKIEKEDYIIGLLKQGKNLALISDAGTPGISDPGSKLVEKVIESQPKAGRPLAEVKVVPIPGASAVAAAASVSGFPMDKFIFMGFPPVKKKRKKFFEEVIDSKYPVIFYESCHRILKTLNELKDNIQPSNLDPQVVVCRELTKKFETIYRGKIGEVISAIEKDIIKGEFVVVINAGR